MTKKKTYAVACGRKIGLFTSWPEAEAQVKGFAGARFKGFASRLEAEGWLQEQSQGGGRAVNSRPVRQKPIPRRAPQATTEHESTEESRGILIYTDGGCSGNPGPGGYGAIIRDQGQEKELSGGFRLTTNNRMEMMACVAALRSLKGCARSIILYSDSSYVVNAINKGWARSWQRRGWVKSDHKPALNQDLWQEILELIAPLSIEFRWVKGHSGNPLNERCDQLAVAASKDIHLPPDAPYELHKSQGAD